MRYCIDKPRPTTIEVGPYLVRVRPLYGCGAPDTAYDVLEHGKVVGTLLSMPSRDDCRRAIAEHKSRADSSALMCKGAVMRAWGTRINELQNVAEPQV